MMVKWQNSLGEDEVTAVWAEFTSPDGVQWIVTRSWRIDTPRCVRRDECEFITNS